MLKLPVHQNPYVGLRPFNSDESLLFFGRDSQTGALLQNLHNHRFVALIGSSGSGKSSLVRAGLIPKLKGGFLVAKRDRWHIATMKPGKSPLANLCAALMSFVSANESQPLMHALAMRQAIRKTGAWSILEYVSPIIEETNSNLLLVVDQFEEIFRFNRYPDSEDERSEARDFISIVLELAAQRALPIYLVFTMRSDFLGDCDQFQGLPEALNRGHYLVPRLTREQIRDTIERPVRLFKAEISPSLVDRILNEVGQRSDHLPIMQHALMLTWQVFKTEGGSVVEPHHYESAGTMRKAISQHADRALEGMRPAEIALTEQVFRLLCDTDGGNRRIRRAVQLSEICEVTGVDEKLIMRIVKAFQVDSRSFLISTIDAERGPIIDISHESLIRQWDRLRKWVDEEAESRDIYLRISKAANFYKSKQAGLWRNPELQMALSWRKDKKPNARWALRYNSCFNESMVFLDASRLRRRLTISAYVCSTLLLFAAILFQLQNTQELLESARIARDSTASALGIAEDNADQARLNAVRANTNANRAALAERAALQARDSTQNALDIVSIKSDSLSNTLGEVRIARDSLRESLIYAQAQESLAVYRLNELTASQETARQNRISTLSLALANRAKQQRTIGEPHRAGILARQAYYLDRIANGEFLSEVYNELHLTLSSPEFSQNSLISNVKYNDDIRAIDVRSDGAWVAAAGNSGMIHLWSPTSNTQLDLNRKGIIIRALKFSPDNKMLAIGGDDKIVSIWRTLDYDSSPDRFQGTSRPHHSSRFSPFQKCSGFC